MEKAFSIGTIKKKRNVDNKTIKGVKALKWFPSLVIFLLLVCLTGCGQEIPKPELNRELHIGAIEVANLLKVTNHSDTPGFSVRHHIKENNVFVQCVLSGISFRNDNKKKMGKLIVSVDGIKTEEIASPIFIIRGLTPGNHLINLEVVSLENKPYDLSRELIVTIP